jgi:isopropylmalate/homocitrate/citramalate synthase
MGHFEVVEEERGLQHVELGYTPSLIAGGKVAKEHLACLDQLEEVGVRPAFVHDIPGDVYGDLAVGLRLHDPLERGQAGTVGATFRPITSDPEPIFAQFHPFLADHIRSIGAIVYDAESRVERVRRILMTNEPWKTDQWFSSPWNYLPEVTKDFEIPDDIQVHDVTLRDGEQQAGVEFTADDKVRIATSLAEAGIHRIEAGLPAVSPADKKAIERMVAEGLPTEIYAFSRCMVSDVELALDCGVSGVVMEVPASHHLIEKAYQWPVERAIEASVEATRYAHENGLKVTFFPIDATRSTMTQLLDDLEAVATDGHVDNIALVDTFGVTSPHAIRYYTRRVKERLDVPLETHFHMDFGMGVANTILAVAEGASVIHTTVSGIGERAGNAPTEETVLALLTMYGVDIGIRTEKFTEIARLVADLSGVQQPGNRPVTGEKLFNVESGIIATWVNNVGDDLLEPFPYRPELVGQSDPEIVMGKGSGLDSVSIWLGRNGIYDAEIKEIEAILAEVKGRSLDKKGLLDNDEFLDVVREVIPDNHKNHGESENR